MNTHLGKNFIVILRAVVLGLGVLPWLAERPSSKDAPPVAAATESSQLATVPGTISQVRQDSTASTSPDAQGASAQSSRAGVQYEGADTTKAGYDEGYRIGYQDGERDCQQSHAAARASVRPATRYYSSRSTRHYYTTRSTARSGVAGVAYAAPRRKDHSTRNMILTVAAPAALAAGIGGIAGGGKGAGIGALIGGGGGAL